LDLSGAVVIVTGASSGIGAATTAELTAAGARVLAVGRDEAALRQLSDATSAEPAVADVADPEHGDRLVRRALDQWGRLDAVVANAGVGFAGDFAGMPVERLDELIAVNLRAPVRLVLAALPVLIDQRRGAIAVVSSIAGAVPVPGEAAYAMTKHALEAFADSLRGEVREHGVTVSTVRPGVVATAFFDRRGAAYDRRFPRPIPPERIATAVVDALRTGRPTTTVPRWLGVPALLRRHARPLYDRLAP
jgi:NADP-dependent 3-hydroxy acid dehydrogenase YdfG